MTAEGHPNTLVALHTQALGEPLASTWTQLLGEGLRAARLNNAYADRRRLEHSLAMMSEGARAGLYDRVYVDARTGLPNMASFTRVRSDWEVGERVLGELPALAELDRRGDEAPVYAELARKRRYLEALRAKLPIGIDEHRVSLRRHDPATGVASFRIDLCKLDATGNFIRVVVELTQTSSRWHRAVIELDADGDSAAASEIFHATVYRYAAFDSESLFLHMQAIEGVVVERVARGIVGPAFVCALHERDPVVPVEFEEDALGGELRALVAAQPAGPQLVFSFQSDVAARDLREERSNDPLVPLLRERLQEAERARYDQARARTPFKVFRDRKFVVTPGAQAIVDRRCREAGTRNLVYRLETRRQT